MHSGPWILLGDCSIYICEKVDEASPHPRNIISFRIYELNCFVENVKKRELIFRIYSAYYFEAFFAKYLNFWPKIKIGWHNFFWAPTPNTHALSRSTEARMLQSLLLEMWA